jgi:hypothetical protein
MYQGTLGRLLNHSERFQVYEDFDACFRLPRWMTGSAARVMSRKFQEK